MTIKKYKTLRDKRRVRIRAKIRGTSKRPRLSVFRSSKHIYAQLVDDIGGETLVAASDHDLNKEDAKKTKMEIATGVGRVLAEKASKVGIRKVVFDRGGYEYHGRVRALAEGARKGGLEF